MRILVTGGAGQVGWELRRALAVFGDIVAPPRETLDLASADSILACMRAQRPDLVVNSAAYTAVDKAQSEPALAMKVNGEAPRILAEEAVRLGAALVHYSTDYVFDGGKAGAYVEDDATGPVNVYGETKLAGERAIAASGCPHLVLRTSWVYAPRGRNFLLTMLRLARERKELKVVDDQLGAPTSARMIAGATAGAIAALIARGRPDPDRFREAGGLYHLTAAGQTSWFGFAQAILAGRTGVAKLVPIPTSGYPTPAQRPRNSVLDNGRFRGRFGFGLPDWETGLALCLEELDRDYQFSGPASR
ncbi:MAG TPA: dTDP-4-dehydrorhamnose reductase [Burkholderiales bacterium]|nr:dTDP-4-dehydrorhamnose reductase [Burkholderiales bacterium]